MRFFSLFMIWAVGSLWSVASPAQKLNFDVAYYSIQADPPSATAGQIRVSGPGAYSLSGLFGLRPDLEFGVGYTVFLSKGISGDMGFGPDLFLAYFPLTMGSALEQKRPGIDYQEIANLRPFVQASFHQRQFQSAQSAYSGFGFGGGAEFQWGDRQAYRIGIRSMTLAGPAGAKFEYFDLGLGFQLQF